MRFPSVAHLLFAVAVGLVGSMALAQEATEVGQSAKLDGGALVEADIPALIKDLDANRFSKRQDASRKLKELGKPAVGALVEAVLGTSREASSRAFEILKEHFGKGEGALKEAAKQALQKIAESDKARVSRKAKDVLEPKPLQPAAPIGGFRGRQIQIQFKMGGAQRIQMRNANGVKDIEVKEKDRTIKIKDDPNKGISIEITEKKNGKDVKRKFEAKNAEELKKKHPEGYKLYDKYGKGGPAQIQGFQIPAIQIRQLGRAVPVPARRMIAAKSIAKQLEKTSAQIEDVRKLLEKIKANPQQTDSLEKAIEQLKKTQAELKETIEKIGAG